MILHILPISLKTGRTTRYCSSAANTAATGFRRATVRCSPGTSPCCARHRGYDAGALRLAQALARALAAPLLFSTVSRLLIDLNRSPHHPRLYSEATRALPPTQRRAIFERYYQPYRNTLRHWIADAVDGGQRVVHLSCHSFTPELGGRVRNADLGLLYDPARASEAALCRRWQALLGMRMPGLAVRRNYPYQGKADSFTTELRRHYADDQYWASKSKSTRAAWPALAPGPRCGRPSSIPCAPLWWRRKNAHGESGKAATRVRTGRGTQACRLRSGL